MDIHTLLTSWVLKIKGNKSCRKADYNFSFLSLCSPHHLPPATRKHISLLATCCFQTDRLKKILFFLFISLAILCSLGVYAFLICLLHSSSFIS